MGTTSKEEGTLASDLAALQDLLVRPAQRIMKLGLFMDDMAADARQAQRAQEAEGACSSCSPVTADTPPSPTPESPGSVQALPFFELPDGAGARVAFHHVDRAKVVEWVQTITEVVQKSWGTRAMTQRAGQSRAPAPSPPSRRLYRRDDEVENETALTLDGKRLSQYALLTRTDRHEPRSPPSSRVDASSTRRGGEGTAAHAPPAASVFYF